MANYTPNILDNNIISTRIRLARNLQEHKFKIENKAVATEVIKSVNRSLTKIDNFDLLYVANMKPTMLEYLKEKYLISQALIENTNTGAVFINSDETLSIMVNEEDVIREQCFMRGLRLTEAYKRLDRIDDELSKNLNFAFSESLGFLTSCPTNVGTGLRASVMMFLPAITESGKIKEVVEKVKQLGLTVRGVYGEGSSADGYMYQISNEVTLGVSEHEILNSVEETVITLCELERKTAETFYLKKEIQLIDRCKRAYAILSNAELLSYEEYIKLIASVKLGINLGVMEFDSPYAIDDLTIAVRPAHLSLNNNGERDMGKLDYLRARFVREQIAKIKGEN